MGESLADMDKHQGGRPSENWSYRGTGLKELGIGKNQSHRYQRMIIKDFVKLIYLVCFTGLFEA